MDRQSNRSVFRLSLTYVVLALLLPLGARVLAGPPCDPSNQPPGYPPPGSPGAGDCDGDGIANWQEICDCDQHWSPNCQDRDGNGVPDECDWWFPSWCEEHPGACGPFPPPDPYDDCNGNMIPDDVETDPNSPWHNPDDPISQDCNGDGVPDICQDSDNDGIPDVCESGGACPNSPLCDCDGDGDLDPPPPLDCTAACQDGVYPPCPPPPPSPTCPPCNPPWITAVGRSCPFGTAEVRSCDDAGIAFSVWPSCEEEPRKCFPWTLSEEVPFVVVNVEKVGVEECASRWILEPTANLPGCGWVYWKGPGECPCCYVKVPVQFDCATPTTPIIEGELPSLENDCQADVRIRARHCIRAHELPWQIQHFENGEWIDGAGGLGVSWDGGANPVGDQWEYHGHIENIEYVPCVPYIFRVRVAEPRSRMAPGTNENDWDRWNGSCTSGWSAPFTIDCIKPGRIRASKPDEFGAVTLKVDHCNGVTWEIVKNGANCGELQPLGGNGRTWEALLKPCAPLCNGERVEITVRAHDVRCDSTSCESCWDDANCYREEVIPLRESCNDSGSADLGSVLFQIGLGTDARGRSVGALEIREEQATPALQSPAGLRYVWDRSDTIVIRDANDGISQIRSPLTFVDIITTPPIDRGYTIRVYASSQAVPVHEQNNPNLPIIRFDVTGYPHTVWVVQNVGPQGSYGQIDLTQSEDAEPLDGSLAPRLRYSYRPLSTGWRLETYDLRPGTATLVEVKESTWDGAVESRVTRNAGGEETSRVRRTLTEDRRKLLERAVDPLGANLVTRFTYTTYGDRIQSVEHPDQSWQYFEYNGLHGQVGAEYRPWLDGPTLSEFSPSSNNSRKIAYTFWNNVPSLPYRPLNILEYVPTGTSGGITTIRRTDFIYEPEEILPVVRQADYPTPTNPDPATALETVTVYRSQLDMRPVTVQFPDGRLTTYQYDQGLYSPTPTDPFVPGAATDPFERVTITDGTMALPGGKQNKTLRREIITGAAGHRMMERTLVCTADNGGSFALVGWELLEYDARMRLVRVTRSDNTESNIEWSACCQDAVQTDPNGIRTTTESDSLGRVTAITKEAIGSTSEFPQQLALQTEYLYTKVGAFNRVTRLVSPVGGVSPPLNSSEDSDLA